MRSYIAPRMPRLWAQIPPGPAISLCFILSYCIWGVTTSILCFPPLYNFARFQPRVGHLFQLFLGCGMLGCYLCRLAVGYIDPVVTPSVWRRDPHGSRDSVAQLVELKPNATGPAHFLSVTSNSNLYFS